MPHPRFKPWLLLDRAVEQVNSTARSFGNHRVHVSGIIFIYMKNALQILILITGIKIFIFIIQSSYNIFYTKQHVVLASLTQQTSGEIKPFQISHACISI